VEPTPQVTGTTELPRHTNLSNLDLKGAYSTAQKKGQDNTATGEGGIGVDYEEFCWILGLCGHIKYDEIPEMTMPMRVEGTRAASPHPDTLLCASGGCGRAGCAGLVLIVAGRAHLPCMAGIIRNFLQEEDEHKVISKCCCPPLPLYDTSLATPLEGSTQEVLDAFILFWKRIDLKHVYGFPTWEVAVFDLLHTSFEQLRSIFDYYAKSGTAGSSSTGALLTMQQSELQTLALDVGMNTDKFSMTRVINIFRRADQVDDTKKSSDANVKVLEGEDAKAVRPRTELRTVEQR
jgi:hypothetical protein